MLSICLPKINGIKTADMAADHVVSWRMTLSIILKIKTQICHSSFDNYLKYTHTGKLKYILKL